MVATNLPESTFKCDFIHVFKCISFQMWLPVWFDFLGYSDASGNAFSACSQAHSAFWKTGNSETYDVQSWRQWVPDLELDDGLKRFSLVWRFFSSFLPEFPFCRERRNSEIFEFPVDVNAASKYKPSDVTSPIRGVQLFFMAMQTNTSWQHSNVSLLWSHMFYVLLKCVSPPSFRRIGSFDEDVSRSSHSDFS